MILYKYVSFESGKNIIEGNSIGFSKPKHFNDPFDLPSYPEEPTENPVESMFAGVRATIKNQIWTENTGILSLTRTPTNPLMWAHYAQKHTGVVVGLDCVVAGFTIEQRNLIPAQYGSVIYVSKRSTEPFISQPKVGIHVGATHHFPQEHYEKLQRVFLQKPMCWSYEEEVRVVRCLKGLSEEDGGSPGAEFRVIEIDGRPLHLLPLPTGSIRELYFGFHCDDQAADELYHSAKKRYPKISAYECTLDAGNLSVGVADYCALPECADS